MKIVAAIILTIAGICHADVVTLKDGRWVEGNLLTSSGTKIKTSAGTLTYKANEIASVKREKLESPAPQPCQADFGTEFGTRPRPQQRDYTLAPKPSYKPMPTVRQPEKKVRPGTQSKPTSIRKQRC